MHCSINELAEIRKRHYEDYFRSGKAELLREVKTSSGQVDICMFKPSVDRPHFTLMTDGASDNLQRAPALLPAFPRVEFMLVSLSPQNWMIDLLQRAVELIFNEGEFLGYGHGIRFMLRYKNMLAPGMTTYLVPPSVDEGPCSIQANGELIAILLLAPMSAIDREEHIDTMYLRPPSPLIEEGLPAELRSVNLDLRSFPSKNPDSGISVAKVGYIGLSSINASRIENELRFPRVALDMARNNPLLKEELMRHRVFARSVVDLFGVKGLAGLIDCADDDNKDMIKSCIAQHLRNGDDLSVIDADSANNIHVAPPASQNEQNTQSETEEIYDDFGDLNQGCPNIS